MSAQVHAILALAGEATVALRSVADRLGLPLLTERPTQLPDSGFVLLEDGDGLALQELGPGAPGPIRADFAAGAAEHRRRFGGGRGQMIARAVGLNKVRSLRVLDATAGLGRDAYVLASLGCRVTLLERVPVVAELLADALQRGMKATAAVRENTARMRLERCDGSDFLRQQATAECRFDVVYLDPMFPERSKSASVKKEMAAFHALVGQDADADQLLPLAQVAARFRVVVKRPRSAPFLNGQQPSFQFEGKSNRFDIYVNARIEA